MKNLPTLPNATLWIEYAIGYGNGGARSDLRTGTTSDTPLARLGQPVKYIQDRCGHAHLTSSTGDARVESSPLLGGRRALNFYGISASTFASSYTQSTSNYLVATVITTPGDAYSGTAWNYNSLNNTGGNRNHCFSTSPHRLFLRRNTTGNPWGSWFGSVWQNPTTPLWTDRGSTTYVLAILFRNGQPPRFFVNGIPQTVASPSNYAVSVLGPITLGSNGAERINGLIGWWGAWIGTATDEEVAAVSAVLGSWFRVGRTQYGSHEDLRVVELGAQGYTTDGRYHWFSNHSAVVKRSPDFAAVLASTDARLSGQTHVGGCHLRVGYLWLVSEYDTGGVRHTTTLQWRDPHTLALVGQKALNDYQASASAVCVVPEHGAIYVTDYYTGTHLYKYDLESQDYIAAISLPMGGIQGITYRQKFFYFSKGGSGHASRVYRIHEDRLGTTDLEYVCDDQSQHNQDLEYTEGATNELRWIVQRSGVAKLVYSRLNPQYILARKPLLTDTGKCFRVGEQILGE